MLEESSSYLVFDIKKFNEVYNNNLSLYNGKIIFNKKSFDEIYLKASRMELGKEKLLVLQPISKISNEEEKVQLLLENERCKLKQLDKEKKIIKATLIPTFTLFFFHFGYRFYKSFFHYEGNKYLVNEIFAKFGNGSLKSPHNLLKIFKDNKKSFTKKQFEFAASLSKKFIQVWLSFLPLLTSLPLAFGIDEKNKQINEAKMKCYLFDLKILVYRKAKEEEKSKLKELEEDLISH